MERVKRTAVILGLSAVLMWCAGASSAQASVYYPGGGKPPATQVVREVSLFDAAHRGLIKLGAKGVGDAETTPWEGDRVRIDLTNKKVTGPITVIVHVEFTTDAHSAPEDQATLASNLPEFERRTEAELNRRNYKAKNGDPIGFDVDYRFRSPSDPPTTGYHQVKIIDPTIELDEPDPNYRARIGQLGEPNVLGAEKTGTFSSLTFGKPKTLAHETLHLAGLDDRYGDFYKVGGKKYPLPSAAMTNAQLTKFAKNHKPPLPPPPAGEVVSDNLPGTGPCDIMADSYKDCSRISKRDLKFFEDQAGIELDAKPGDMILNKSDQSQSFAVGFETKLFAPPGEKAVAKGLSVYCINANLAGPLGGERYDVIGPTSQVPGFDPLTRLLALNAQLQTSVTAPVPGMQTAIWNVTNGEDVDQSLESVSDPNAPDEARALLAQVGIAEDSYPQGLPYLPDPNAASKDTAAVTQGGVIKTAQNKRTKRRPTAIIQFAQLYPTPLRAGGSVRGDLLVSVIGHANRLGIKVQGRSGGRWKSVHNLGRRKIKVGSEVLALKLGHLGHGRYRLALSALNHHRVQSTRRVAFGVR